MPVPFELWLFVRIAIETGQNGGKLPIDEHKVAFRIIAIDQNRDGLKGHDRHGPPPGCGGVRSSDVTLEPNCLKSDQTGQRMTP
jgi:hypothetical protein